MAMSNAEKLRRWRENNPDKLKAQQKRANDKKRMAGYYKDNEEKIFNRYLERTYDITYKDYQLLSEEQGGTCAICNCKCDTGKRLAVDHCHTTGKVRGLLCARCNRGLGNFDDDLDRLQASVLYLKKYQ